MGIKGRNVIFGEQHFSDNAGTIAISLWFKITAWDSAWQVLASHQDSGVAGWLIQRKSSENVFYVRMVPAGSSAGATFNFTPDNDWHHVFFHGDAGVHGHGWLDGIRGTDATTFGITFDDSVTGGLQFGGNVANMAMAEAVMWHGVPEPSDGMVKAAASGVPLTRLGYGPPAFYAPMYQEADAEIRSVMLEDFPAAISGSPIDIDHPLVGRSFQWDDGRVMYAPVVAGGGFIPYPNPRYALTGGMQADGGGIS